MGSILTPAIIVAVIGLVAGIILTVASKLMYVPVDERVTAIREALPGANCGACGFAGCDDYAAALVDDGSLSTALCPVGGAAVAAEIAGIMGVEAGAVAAKVATVMCAGHYGVTNRIMDTDKIHTCKEAKMFYGGQWACPHGCLGLGDCVTECAYDAIRVINGVAMVDRESCVGCGACAKVCPNHIIDMVSEKSKVYVACKSTAKGAATRKICTSGCIGCKKCEKACKFEAVKIENNLAQIDFDKCKNCGLCAKDCPTGAIMNLRKKKAPAAPAEKEA